MKPFLLQLLFLCSMSIHVFSSSVSSDIIETCHFEEIVSYASPDALVLVDIDDTLLVPVQTLGADVWFLYQLQKNKHERDPLDKTLAQWEAIRHLTRMKIVEPGSEKIVSALQKKNIRVMGLTTQGLALATRTIQQLLDHQIDLSKTAPSQKDHYFNNGQGVLYRKGVLFTSGTPKGPALRKLLDLMGMSPKKIVFINDKKTHLLDVATAAKELGIEFIGLRYSYSDERVRNFLPELAEVQFHHSNFSHILSDEEAAKILQEQKAQNGSHKGVSPLADFSAKSRSKFGGG
ncbi:MAG: DUF2608 domain-containing protein [Chlamydiales bacterium]|nr:DUF2608 domain-containing protein [Chlamydiales bacterium]